MMNEILDKVYDQKDYQIVTCKLKLKKLDYKYCNFGCIVLKNIKVYKQINKKLIDKTRSANYVNNFNFVDANVLM